MVEILCPHCDEDIELDDDASGEFACPYCEDEFEWNTEPEVEHRKESLEESGDSSSTLPSIHPIQWVGHGLSFFVLVFLIFCLTSGSYYSIIVLDNDAKGDDALMMELEFGISSYTGLAFLEDEIEITYVERITELDKELASMECLGEDLSYCAEMIDEIDHMESWKFAGNFLNFFLILALLCSIAVFASRMGLLLDHFEIIALQERMYIISNFCNRFMPFIIAGLLLTGMALFMLISPGAGLFEDLLAMLPNNYDLESGFGFIVWLSVIIALAYPVFSFYEMEVA